MDQSVREFMAEVAAPTPSATAGGVCAITTAAAAGLAAMAARLSPALTDAENLATRAESLQEQALELSILDGQSYTAVLTAQRLPRDDPRRADELRTALESSAEPPLRIACLGAEIASLAADLTARGKATVAGDATSAATLAAGAARGAASLARINLVWAGIPLERAEKAEHCASSARVSADAALAQTRSAPEARQ